MSTDKDAGLAALQRGDFAGAIPSLESAAQSDPNDFDARLYLGAAYSQSERHTEAVETLTQAVYLQPMNPQVRYNLAVAFERAGWNEQAIEVLGQVLQIQPDYAQAQQALARLQPPAPAPPPLPGYAPPGQANIPGYAPPVQGQSPAPSPSLAPQSFQGTGAEPQQNSAPQPMYAPTPPPPISGKSVAGGLLALLGVSIATGLLMGFIMVGIQGRIPFLGCLTGWTTGTATKFFTGGSTSAGGVIAALFTLLACGTFLLILNMNGFEASRLAVSCIIAVIWAYSTANGKSGH